MKTRSIIFSLFIMLVLLTSMVFQVTPAYAADQTIGGTAVSGNLRITVKDNGAMTVEQYSGSAWLQNFYPSSTGDAKGSTLWAAGTMYNMGGNSTWTPTGGVAATPVSNTTIGDTITTVWTTANGLQITQTTQYTDGTQYYNLTWAIQNTTGAAISDLRLFHGGDTLLAGSDAGIGWWETMGSNTVGVTHPTSGQLMWLKGVTAPSHYDSIAYNIARANVNAGALTDTVNPNPSTDNGYAMQWNNATLAAGATWTVYASERFAQAGSTAPILTGISPASGPLAGGTSVTITGTNLTGGTFTFGGVAATCTVAGDGLSATCTTPAHAAGPVDVSVTTSGGTDTLLNGFTYVDPIPAPTITGLAPTSGPVAGGTTVVITGTNLTGGTVTFGGAAATCTVDSPTQITCTTPPHAAGAVDVVVTTPGGPVTSTGGFTYVAVPTPTITGLAPTSGPVAGGTTVVITGTNLTGGTVTFGGAAATCTVDSPTQITCTTPPHAAGAVDVVVTTPGGSVTSTGGFTYVATPAQVLPPVSLNVCPPGSRTYTSGDIVVPPAAGTGYTDVDVAFVIDTTGSMGGQIDSAKAGAIDIMTGVKATFPGAQFAVIEYKDYPPQDTLPFFVHQVLTTNNSLVSTAINGLSASGGGDGPESAGAAFIAAQGLAWRGGTVGKFIVLITDAPAQPVDVASGKGIDTILGELNTANITLLVVASGSQTYWEEKAALTGDDAAVIVYVADTFDEDVIDLIIGAASRTLNWTLSNPTYNSWVSSAPASYSIGADGDTYTFAVTITVPLSATGSHTFTINYALDGTVTATEQVTVNIACAPLPDDWTGTAEVISNQPIVTLGRPHIGNPQQISAYAGFGNGANTAYLPMLFKKAFGGGSYNSAFYVQNTSASTATFDITYYNLGGTVACIVNNSLAQGASKGYWVPAETCLPDGWVGGAVITSNNPVAVVGRPHIGSEIMSYNTLQSGGTTAHLPMLFRAAFNGSYNAAIYIQNATASAATFTMSFYSESGALTCEMTGQTIEARGIKNYWLPTQTCVPSGWSGSVTITSDQNVVALARTHVGSQISTYAGFNAAGSQAYVPMVFRRAFADNYTSALYIQNVTNSAATVTISYRKNDGTETCAETLNLAAHAAGRLWTPTQACIPDGWAGGALITSTQNVVAVGRSHVLNTGEVASYPGHIAAFNQAFLPMLFKTAFGNYESAMYVQNVSASPADISIIFRDASGVVGCTVSETLPAFATKGYWLPNVCAP